jgi:hypothetical protein
MGVTAMGLATNPLKQDFHSSHNNNNNNLPLLQDGKTAVVLVCETQEMVSLLAA